MRSDIINEILSVEDHASQLVKEAQDEGRMRIMQAQTQSNQDVHDEVAKRRAEHQVELEKAEADSAVRLENYQASLQGSDMMGAEVVDDLASRVVLMVSQTTLFGEKT